jgi:hypothetical protein
MNTSLEIVKPTEVRPANRNTLAPSTFGEMMKFSEMLAASTFVPKDFVGKPQNVLVAIQWGMEIGLAPMQALQNIAVINGRPSLWGDAALAIVQNHPAYEWHTEAVEGTGDAMTGVFTIKRKGSEPHTSRFTVADAKKANLWGKAGPWTQYPQRMLPLRARGFGLRDKFADAMKGLITAEEARDYPTQQPPLMTTDMNGNMVPVPEKEAAAPAAPVPFEYPPPFHYENGTLRCTPVNVQKRLSKKGGEFVAVKFVGGKVEHKDTVFCFHANSFDALLGAVNQDCTFVLNVSKDGYADIVEILSIGGVDYVKPELTQQLEASLAITDEIPF